MRPFRRTCCYLEMGQVSWARRQYNLVYTAQSRREHRSTLLWVRSAGLSVFIFTFLS